MTLRFEVHDAQGSQSYYWRIKDGDDILAKSETMYNKSDAVAAANKMKNNTSDYTFEVISTSNRDKPYSWHAKAGNNRLVVSSTNSYRTYSDASDGMNHVKRNAPYAVVEDMTRTAAR